jgi:hypothetical protein
VVTGRMLWRAFADQLGVIAEPVSAASSVAMAVAGGALAAIVAAQIPAAMSTRSLPAQALRSE